jgi:hypothetical protein
MLEGLEGINWGGLSHAYGPAADVPGLIRALADRSEEVRSEAIDELFGTIVHQGSLYTATAAAVPFLIELAEEPAVCGREQILHLLQSISEGWLNCQRFAPERARMPSRVAERHARELPHYQSAHAAVEKGFDVLAGLLRDAEGPIRMGAFPSELTKQLAEGPHRVPYSVTTNCVFPSPKSAGQPSSSTVKVRLKGEHV